MSLGSRIKSLRKQAKLTQKDIADKLGMGNSNFGHIENDRVTPTSTDLEKIADILGTNANYLLKGDEYTQSSDPYALTPKDERDIAKQLERIKASLESDMALANYGEPIDDEDREALLASLENTLRLSKYMAKKKFTPNKYRKDT
jgi:transcriptional regulator with XRE-family HTH domain